MKVKAKKLSGKLRFGARSVFTVVLALVIGLSFLAQGSTTASPVSVNVKEAVQDGYTLIAPTNSDNVYLVNNDGVVVHKWQTNHFPGLDTKLLPNGQLLRTYDTGLKDDFPMGGRGGGIQIINWDGSVAWDYQYANKNHVLHHDAMMMPNGDVLTSAWEKIPEKRALKAGVDPANIDPTTHTVWGDSILEISPKTNKIVWRWNAYDHLVQDYSKKAPNYGKPANHPRRLDANYFKYVQKPDWLHVNAVDYNPATDQIMVSAREFNEFWVIDHSTTTAQAATSNGGRYGHGGDLLYRYGNPEAYGHGTFRDRKLYLQHDAHWIEADVPGEGDVMVFNNGDPRPDQPAAIKVQALNKLGSDNSQAQDEQDQRLYRGRSTVLELKLPQNPDGSYSLGSNNQFTPASVVWQYAPHGKNRFFSQFMGSAQRLPNGDTLICNAMGGKAFEVTPDGKTVWKYKNNYTDVSGKNQLFRAYKFTPDYSGLTKLGLD